MALKTFEHVLILADDVDKTKDFYVDILGLEVGYRPDFPFKGYWLYLKDNKVNVKPFLQTFHSFHIPTKLLNISAKVLWQSSKITYE